MSDDPWATAVWLVAMGLGLVCCLLLILGP
jgi:hypothetical protein